ncbi:MAG: putative glycoside hydrolase [Coriobacteriia bacterium]|nr:putative glycoside hydrolase [Coriobacteriia bacterium]
MRLSDMSGPRAFALACVAFALACGLAAPEPARAWTPGSPLTTPYPRLAMWWPDTWSQPAAQLARYDWLLLGPWDDPAVVAQVKAAHPDEIILNATNACEISYDPDLPLADEENAQIVEVPAQWLLTQCGATLTSGIAADQTVVAVSAVTTTTPAGVVALFEPDDVVVIDGELARVTAVNATSRTLTLQRGFMKPSASHSIGSRIAAGIAFWPGSLVMDLTAACPRVTVDAAVGPETWGEYNARAASVLATTAAWDGMMIDRADGNESWLIGDSTARSIDPGRSNSVPPTYDAFDDAWNTGLTGYELRLRALLGDDRILMTNWGYPNYPTLNGNNLEAFPNADAASMPWHDFVFGPVEDVGGYLEWLANARQPNLTTIETYEDDGGPSATGDGSYVNPAAKPGFIPNYRKMRFGLTTALLGDGFFSYEINTNGHGGLGLLWFDEYDGAGRGRGWLGQPLGPAEQAGAPDVYVRRFTGGIAVVNASGTARTVPLGALYRRLLGAQARAVNDGRLASSVTIGPKDGAVLARTSLATAPAILARARSAARVCARDARLARSFYGKRRRSGSRSRRASDTRAYGAWNRVAATADALAATLASAYAHSLVSSGSLAPSMLAAESRASRLASEARAAYSAGHLPRASLRALSAAYAARANVLGVAVSAR